MTLTAQKTDRLAAGIAEVLTAWAGTDPARRAELAAMLPETPALGTPLPRLPDAWYRWPVSGAMPMCPVCTERPRLPGARFVKSRRRPVGGHITMRHREGCTSPHAGAGQEMATAQAREDRP